MKCCNAKYALMGVFIVGLTTVAVVMFEPLITMHNFPIAVRIVFGMLAALAASALVWVLMSEWLTTGKGPAAAANEHAVRDKAWFAGVVYFLLLVGSAVLQTYSADDTGLAIGLVLDVGFGFPFLLFVVWEAATMRAKG